MVVYEHEVFDTVYVAQLINNVLCIKAEENDNVSHVGFCPIILCWLIMLHLKHIVDFRYANYNLSLCTNYKYY